MKKPDLSPIGMCPICYCDLYGPDIGSHVYAVHPEHSIGQVDPSPAEIAMENALITEP
jgi:hypothetical protein